MSVDDEGSAALALPLHNAFDSLLRYALTTIGARRGTLSIERDEDASLKAFVGFADAARAGAFARSAHAQRTIIPLDGAAANCAVVALEPLPESFADLAPAVRDLLGAQVKALIEADARSAALAAMQRTVRSLIDDAAQPAIAIGADGIVQQWNDAAAVTFGYSPAQAVGHRAVDLIVPPYLRARYARRFALLAVEPPAALAGRRITMPAVRRDGKPLVVDLHMSFSTGSDGLPLVRVFFNDVTELERTRERLTRSEHLLRQAQQIASLGSFEHDLNTDVLFCSEELYRILAIDPREDVLLADIDELIHADDRPAARAAYLGALERGTGHDIEYRMRRRTGEAIVVHCRGHVVMADGEPRFVYGTVEDITERRRREAEHQHLASRFAQAFDYAPLGISIISAEPETFGTFTRVNSAYCALLGISAEQIVGRHFTAYTVPDDHTISLEATADLLAGRVSIAQVELRMMRSCGAMIWVRQTRSLRRDADGRPLSFFTHVEDVTGRKADQTALAQVNARLRRSLDDAPIGMALTSTDPATLGRFIEVNPALCRMTGFDLNMLGAMSFLDLVHPEGRARAGEAMLRLVRGGQTVCTYEERTVRADRSYGWMSVHASIAHDEAGRPMYCISQIVDISKRKQAENRLAHLASHDALTGLLNRRGLTLETSQRFASGTSGAPRAALLLLDLDHFKYVNDTMGHLAGDRALRKIGKLLRSSCEPGALIARVGGDEFLIVLPNATEAAAVAAADAVRLAIAANVALSTEADIRATTSIGIVVVDAWNDHSLDEEIGAADGALTAAKSQGRNRSTVARSLVSSHAALHEQISWTQRVRGAIESNAFTLYAQPILNLRSGAIERYELLLRLIEPDGNVRPPGDFLPIAERAGLMPEIDCWVVRAAIAIAAAEQRAGRKVAFEVNLSGASLTDADVVACIERELQANPLLPATLVFEITETAAIGNMQQACRFAEKIAALGCSFALDDFGAGFSSFYYLKYLPFSDLKIDGEFIRHLVENVSDQHIVRAIVEVARGLGKATIAEFVGDAATASLLAQYGVDFAQGYHIGTPVLWDPFARDAQALGISA